MGLGLQWAGEGECGGAGPAMGQVWENLLGAQPWARAQRPPPGRAEFRAEVLQKKQEALLSQEDSAELTEEHRRLMAWNEAENARQRARRSAGPRVKSGGGRFPSWL